MENLLSFFGLEGSLIAFSFALGGAMWNLDETLSEQAKSDLNKLIKNARIPANGFTGFFTTAFDQIFKTGRFFRPQFARSALVSILLLVPLLFLSTAIFLAGEDASFITDDYRRFIVFIATFAIPINVLGDYLSLWQTRLLLAGMNKYPKIIPVFLLIDLVCTSVIFAVTVVIGVFLFVIFGLSGEEDILVFFFVILGLMGSFFPTSITPSIAFTITTFMTSIWLWVYLIALLVQRLFRPLDYLLKVARYALNDDRPARSVGVFISIVTFLLFTPIALLSLIL